MPSRVATLTRSCVARLHPYVPGEQPKIPGLIKLNTNENPYPPAPAVLKSVRQAVDGRLRLYPDPVAEPLRRKLAALHRCRPENIVIGNGSDELLAMAVRAFVEPVGVAPAKRHRSLVQFFDPSYSLYPVLAEIHGAAPHPVPLNADFDLPSRAELKKGRVWQPNAALTFLTTPNAPSGHGYSKARLRQFCADQQGIVVLDEAYVDFARENAMELALRFPHVLVARTFSKAYSLCFQRIGYMVGHADIIAALHKIRDSYNVNGLGQIAAAATLDHLKYYRRNFEKVIRTREKLGDSLEKLGFKVNPSQTNFLLVEPPRFPAQEWLAKLREKKILVRWFDRPEIRRYLRITIGTDAEAAALMRAVRSLV